MSNETKILLEKIMRIMNKTNSIMLQPRNFGTKHKLYTSEIQVLNIIGRNPGINLTEVAEKLSITKGAIPKIIRKLLAKDLIFRYQATDNKKIIHLKLTEQGQTAFTEHIAFHQKFNDGIIEHFNFMNKEELIFLNNLLQEVETHLDKIKQES